MNNLSIQGPFWGGNLFDLDFINRLMQSINKDNINLLESKKIGKTLTKLAEDIEIQNMAFGFNYGLLKKHYSKKNNNIPISKNIYTFFDSKVTKNCLFNNEFVKISTPRDSLI